MIHVGSVKSYKNTDFISQNSFDIGLNKEPLVLTPTASSVSSSQSKINAFKVRSILYSACKTGKIGTYGDASEH